MGGAFVAVADDATAIYWNPAGLATGSLFSVVAERIAGDQVLGAEGRGQSTRSRFIGLSTPPLGLSYYRTSRTLATPREGAAAADVSRLTTDQLGVTVVQSLTNRVIVGSTLKYVRSRAASTFLLGTRSTERTLDEAPLVDMPASNGWDLDVGAIATFDKIRLGIAARNLRQPAATSQSGSIQHERQVRAGIALLPSTGLILAFDLDITDNASLGKGRDAAFGIEKRWDHLKMAVRAGVRANTRDIGETAISAGASVILRQNMFLDAFVLGGQADAPQSWGVGARVMY